MKPKNMKQVSQNYLLISLLATSFIAIMLVITIVTLERVERYTREHSGFALQTVLQTTDEALQIWANDRIVEFSKWSLSDELLALTKAQLALQGNRDDLLSSPALGNIRLFMKEEIFLNTDIDIFLISPDYVNIASLDNENIGKTSIIAKQRKEFLEKVFLGDIQIVPAINLGVPVSKQDQGINTSFPVTFVAIPIIDLDSTVIAVLAIGLESVRGFNLSSRLGRIGNSGETYFFDGSGRLLTESRFDKTLRDIGLLKPNQRGALSIEIRDPGVNMVAGSIPALPRNKQPLTYMAQQSIDGKDGVNINGYRDYRGVRVLGAWKWNHKLNIGIAVEIDEEEVLRPYYATRTLTIGSISVTALLSIFFVAGIVIIRKRSEEGLMVSEEKYRNIIENANDSIFISDPETREFIVVNHIAAKRLGYTKEELLSKRVEDINSGMGPEQIKEVLKKLRRGKSVILEVRHKHKNGKEIPVEISSKLVDYGGKKVVQSFVRDITERKRAEEELAKHRDHLQELVDEQTEEVRTAKEAAETANRAKSEFLSNMSHELRTPMHAILSFADLGIDKIDVVQKEKLKHYFSRIYESGDRLLKLLNDLLDLSKLEAGKNTLDLLENNLLNSVNSVAAELEPMLTSKSLKLDIVQPDAVPKAMCDAYQIQQVVRNLLSNAIKFTPEGKTITVTFGEEKLISGKSDNGRVPAVSFTVKDEGIGIPEGEAETVFDKFIQSSKTRSGAGGTGLGLAICKEIVAAHGGTIRADSSPEGGAMFKVVLPKKAISSVVALTSE